MSRSELFSRELQDSHIGYIRTMHSPANRDFAELLERVYAHQPAAFQRKGTSRAPLGATDPITTEELSSVFYNLNYVPVTLHRSERKGPKLEIDAFFSEFLFRPADGKRNNLIFLLSEVGCGKTAFINWLITKHGPEWIDKGQFWFLRIDVYLANEGGLLTREQFIDRVISKTLKVIEDNLDTFIFPPEVHAARKSMRSYQTLSTLEERQRLLAALIKAIALHAGRRLVLFIDNLDYVYHLNDRTMFKEEGIQSDTDVIEFVRSVVHAFQHDGGQSAMGDLGANVVIALRPDSYDILQQSSRHFHPSRLFDHGRNAVFVERPDWQRVVHSRADLLEYAVKRIPQERKRSIHEEILRPILDDLEYRPPGRNDPRLIDHLEKITNYGLRDIVEFFSQYSWLEGQILGLPKEAATGLDRLLHSYPVGLLAFMLRGHRLFNQFRSQFPNIYLVARQADAIRGPTGPAPSRAFDDEHTYWLKRLLLVFIKTHNDKKISVRPDLIYEIFCPRQEGYGRDLVQEVLGSMAQVEYSNLIQVHKSKSTGGDHVQVDHLSLTSRGRHCEQFIFDRFFYMQLVVDDYMLPLPRPLIEDFRFGTDVPDYSYIGAPPGEYGERASEMIKRKSRQVLLFLDVLDVSQDKERQRYKPVFEELSRLGVPLPDAKRIKRNIEGEIRALRLNTNLLTEFRVENLAKELRGRRTEIEASLATIYSTSGAAR